MLETAQILKEQELTKKVDDEIEIMHPELEEQLAMVAEVKEAFKSLTDYNKAGAWDILDGVAKERIKEFLTTIIGQKKYSGDKVQVGYFTKSNYVLKPGTTPDPKFLESKVKGDAVKVYMTATGELPEGIEEKSFDVISYKGFINEEAEV